MQQNDIVDGRNLAPVDMEKPQITVFFTSQVMQDLFHQLYVTAAACFPTLLL